MGYFELKPFEKPTDADQNFAGAGLEPILFNPRDYDTDIRYLLPHELEALRKAISRMSGEQGELGILLAEAMDQSSETFHDNAPQEVIVAESIVLAKRAEPYIRALGKLQVVQYPLADSTLVTIGKRVNLRLNAAEFSVDVVGASWLYEEANEENVDIASYDSPIAKVVLGKSPGELIKTAINDKQTDIEILNLINTPSLET